jgi:diadenosine tetraphosphate (Ap4A) HIT family hydrolase
VDVTNFTDADLARLALSSRLRELAEAFRVAVANAEPDLAAQLWKLLTTEVPQLQEAIVLFVRSGGGSWADVAAIGELTEDEARERWAAVEPARTEDPDNWYIRHAQLEPLAQVRDPFSRLLSPNAPREHECLLCEKYRGGAYPAYGGYNTPPGGYLIDDGLWRVSHGPTAYWPAGTLLIEANRHFLDYADMTDEEAAAIGPLIRRLVGPLREATGAPRVHTFSCMEGTEHFHTWLVPRVGEVSSGRAFIANPGYCGLAEAEATIIRIREAMAR